MSTIKIAGSPNLLRSTVVTVGAAAVQALEQNKNRAGYRIIGPIGNTNNLYHGHDSRVAVTSDDIIVPGGRLEDEGEWLTIYRGEVWLISDAAGQTAIIEEIIRT